MFGRIRPFRKRASAVLVQTGNVVGFKNQEDLAQCIGISDRSLRSWITGKKRIDFDKLSECEPLWIPFLERLLEGERKVRRI